MLAILHAKFWPISIGEDRNPEIGHKDIGSLMETRDGQGRQLTIFFEKIKCDLIIDE